MRRIRIVVAYDGTNYCGWQIQPNGITIEEILNRQISKLTGEDIRIIGASRTDSGPVRIRTESEDAGRYCDRKI